METWKDIPGLEGFYQASDFGRIRSVERVVRSKNGSSRINRSRVLSPGAARYQLVRLSVGGVLKTGLAHRLVCMAFHGLPPTPKHQAAHRDGDRYNNVPGNLYWATATENCADRVRHGTWVHGERVNTNKLSAKDVLAIRQRARTGECTKALSLEFNVHRSSIQQIARGATWRHLTP